MRLALERLTSRMAASIKGAMPSGLAMMLSSRRRLLAPIVCFIVLTSGLALTAGGCAWLLRDAHQQGRLRFERAADKLEFEVSARFSKVLNSFRGLRSYFDASQVAVNRDAFRVWVASRRIREDMPGIRGLGFIQHVARADLAAFLEAERADSAPGYQVKTTGQAADLFVIKYIEPLAGNEKAWGFDVGSEAVRREGAERAVKTGQPALTHRIALVQDGRKRPGYLFYLPVYRWASKFDTPADRMVNLVGLIYAPIVLDEFLHGAGAVADDLLDMQLFDGQDAADEQMVFDLDEHARLTPDEDGHGVHKGLGHFETLRHIEISGHHFVLRARSTPAFDTRFESWGAVWFGLTGVLLSVLVSATIWLLLLGRGRAEVLAQRMTADLSAAKQRYQLAIDGGNDGLWDWINVHDHKMWWSPQLYRLLGHEPNAFEASLDEFEGLLEPAHRHQALGLFELALKDAQPLDAHLLLRTSSGAYRWFRCRGKVFFDEEGFAQRMAGSIQDVHDRRVAEQTIRDHSEQLGAIFALSPDGFVSFGPDERVNYVSPAFADLTGISAAEVHGMGEPAFLARLLAMSLNPPDIHRLDSLLVRHADPRDPRSWLARHRLVLEMKPPAGRMLALSLQVARGEAVSRLLLVRDVTHEAEADRVKSDFLSMAAHELRTPMSSIYGFVELLLERELKPERQKDILGKVYRQCEVMISIINELLDLARIENRRGADLECRTCDLAGLVGKVVSDFKPPAGREAPHIAHPQHALQVNADAQKMSQALLNVLSNAYKYSPRGGSVRVSFPQRQDARGGWAGVMVEDEGIGMSPEQLTHVGERFFRADKSGSIPGTGLGVSIVKELMDLMHGALEVQSALGRGTRMILWLPELLPSAPAVKGTV